MDNASAQQRKKLFIVDDSKMMRRIIADIFADDELIEIVGEAADGEEALQILPQVGADVVTLDVQMPVMDGLTTLKHMMIQAPTPTVMLSSYTQQGAAVTFDALRYGAVDFVSKPSNAADVDLKEQAREIRRKVHLASAVEIDAVRYIRAVKKDDKAKQGGRKDYRTIVAIGAAEGGYGPLLKILPRLSADIAATYMVMLYEPVSHVDAFAGYLDDLCDIRVKRPRHNDVVEGGVCYLTSGEEYLSIHHESGANILYLRSAPFDTIRGSINMMMFSVAEVMHDRSLAIILSGLGIDGEEGLEEIARMGGGALVQDPLGSLYKEMPRTAMKKCRSDQVISDARIAAKVNEFLQLQ